MEFSDFECPYCQRGANTIHEVLEAYPDQVRVVFKQLPLAFHSHAELAAQASLAAHAQGNEFFWPYHDLLFENRSALERADLERYAEQVGLDMDRVPHGARARAPTLRPSRLTLLRLPRWASEEPRTSSSTVRAFVARSRLMPSVPRSTPSSAAAQALIDAGSTVGEAFTARVEENLQAAPEAPAPQAERPARPTPDPDAELYVPVGDSAFHGPEDALVTVVAFSEFQCPYCRPRASHDGADPHGVRR